MDEVTRHELLLGIAEGNLSTEQRITAESLLRTDAAFRRDAEDLTVAISALGGEELPAVPHRYFADLLPRIHDRIEQRRSRRWFTVPSFLPVLLRPAAAIAVIAVMVSLYNSMTPAAGLKETLQSSELARQEAASAANDLSLLASSTEAVAIPGAMHEVMVIDPNNYQNVNDLLAVLDESDAQRVTDRLQENIRSMEEQP